MVSQSEAIARLPSDYQPPCGIPSGLGLEAEDMRENFITSRLRMVHPGSPGSSKACSLGVAEPHAFIFPSLWGLQASNLTPMVFRRWAISSAQVAAMPSACVVPKRVPFSIGGRSRDNYRFRWLLKTTWVW